ncbi:MAG: glycoside hydrolase family 127 protein, partial [Kiritimatiellae bacterium]|nr:glycoside hydrolase family 127 protein [Kiritimatiellia bacterium]
MKEDSIANIGCVALKGRLGEKLDAMISHHVEATDVDYITAPFLEKTETRGWWQTEFWGKWMHSAVPYFFYRPSPRLLSKIERGVERMLSSQESCGYIGNYPQPLRCGEGWDVWGMKYTMMGLLHYCDLSSRLSGAAAPEFAFADTEKTRRLAGRALDGCRRLCDYLIGQLGPGGERGVALWQTGNWCGYASSSVLEPVVWLYNRTGDTRYLDFAEYIVRGLSEPQDGPRLVDLALAGVSVADRNGHGNAAESGDTYVMKHNRWKAYEMMSCYQGMLDFADAADASSPCRIDTAALRRAATMAARDIAREEVNLAGGCASSEAWYHGASRQFLHYTRLQETCVTTTWMRLCERLLSLTGESA